MRFSLLLFLFLAFKAYGESACIAHQGSFKQAPANSLEAFAEALGKGADGVEFDINHTREGVALVHHDKKLTSAVSLPGRHCPKDVPINQLDLATIQSNCALEFQGIYYPLPTLEDALSVLSPSGKMIFIELKDHPTYLTRLTIQNHFAQNPENLRMISFKVKFLDDIFHQSSSSPFWSQVKGLDLDVAPWGSPGEYGVNIWNRLYLISSRRYQTKESSVWTLKRKARIEKFLRMKVDFITTDEVELCLSLKNMLRSVE